MVKENKALPTPHVVGDHVVVGDPRHCYPLAKGFAKRNNMKGWAPTTPYAIPSLPGEFVVIATEPSGDWNATADDQSIIYGIENSSGLQVIINSRGVQAPEVCRVKENMEEHGKVDLTAKWKGPLPVSVSLTLEGDPHKMYYQTVEEYLSDPFGAEHVDDFENKEEMGKAIEANTMWTCRWYPRTPVGFLRVSAATLEGCVDYASRVSNG